jgi:hypothetical protein
MTSRFESCEMWDATELSLSCTYKVESWKHT